LARRLAGGHATASPKPGRAARYLPDSQPGILPWLRLDRCARRRVQSDRLGSRSRSCAACIARFGQMVSRPGWITR
jgi:hypothetical protein